MHIESLRNYCLQKPHVSEDMPFGPDVLVFKVHGHIFCLAGLDDDPLKFNVKCDPEKAVALREMHPAIRPGYHMNKQHWNTVIVDGSLSDAMLKAQIDHSYALNARKRPK